MTKPVRLLASLLVLLLFGCGGNKTTTPTPPAANLPALNGSFSFTGTSQNFKTRTISIGGPLQSNSDGHVLGTMGVTTNPNISTCFPQGSSANFSGTLSDQGVLTLTSQPVAGQVITLNATVTSDGNFSSNATYSVAGGCLGGDQGGMAASHLLAGTYTGAFFAGGSLINVTANFDQPGVLIPDFFGSFPITASATFSNTSSCGGFNSASTAAAGSVGAQLGLDVFFTMGSNPTGTSLNFYGSSVDSSGTMFSGKVDISGGPCNGAEDSITLSLKKS
jgi:hypothetical protein